MDSGSMPPKLDKSHGFMQSIIKNQVMRDEYDKQVKEQTYFAPTTPTTTKKREDPIVKRSSEAEVRKRTPKRAPRSQLYVPPHLTKSKENGEPREPSPRNSPEPGKRSSTCKENSTCINKRDLKRTRKGSEKGLEKILFKFEYEDNSATVRTFYVKEDDNAEDLAETFGNQLGLTKPLKKALHHKLSNEIKSCLSST